MVNNVTLKELGSKIDTTLVVVKPGDVVLARVKAVSEYTAKFTRKLRSGRTCSCS